MTTKKDEAEPVYNAPPLGAYPVEEHLRAQREQPGPDGKTPVHESDETGETGKHQDDAGS